MTNRTHIDDGMKALAARDLERAAAAFELAVTADAGDTEARLRLANAYRDLRRLDEAEAEMRAVVAARPRDPKAHSALGVILAESGRPSEAAAAYEAAMAADPAYVTAAGNWLNALQYVPGASDASLAESHARWTALHAPAPAPTPFANPPDADRPLVVGFFSPDLALHPVGRLSVKLFEHLEPRLIRAVVFSNRPAEFEDEISRRIAAVTRWSSVFALSDASLAGFIKQAKVDILIDMAGHTAHARPLLFAARAAPVQAAWLGYPSTTGIPAMDYLLTTEAMAPPGFEGYARERIARLPSTHAVFEPQDAPPVAPLPAGKNGFVTFGCFNNPAKISGDAIASFARILARVPGSRIKIAYHTLRAAGLQARLRTAFVDHGVAGDRIDFSHAAAHDGLLGAYAEVDIALDSFPYSGCMTTCEALWMGVPVVSFPGPLMAGRQSVSVLAAAGLHELIAPDPAGYEDLAVELAGDKRKLLLFRTGLRTRLAQSQLCDGKLFARDFTEALRTMWAAWCAARAD